MIKITDTDGYVSFVFDKRHIDAVERVIDEEVVIHLASGRSVLIKDDAERVAMTIQAVKPGAMGYVSIGA